MLGKFLCNIFTLFHNLCLCLLIADIISFNLHDQLKLLNFDASVTLILWTFFLHYFAFFGVTVLYFYHVLSLLFQAVFQPHFIWKGADLALQDF